MKIITSTILASTIAASTAFAADWGGTYAGASYNIEAGELRAYDALGASTGVYDLKGDLFGGFAGYNVDTGSMVFGGEIAFATGDLHLVTHATAHVETIIDAKARLGLPLGDALVYGVAGGSIGHYVGVTTDIDFAGVNYGAGIEYAVTDNIFIGVEYLAREVGGLPLNILVPGSVEYSIQSTQVRVGFSF
ncbi:MAG: porin family protein [Rhodobacteraceae bacterium]|nr:porin family protein [Paracoccaceae bacterium]